MGTVIKAEGVIETPKLGKIITLQLLTSESCIRGIKTDLTGSSTDVYNGGASYPWVNFSNQFSLTSLGLTNEQTNAAGSTYLVMPLIMDVAISFEAGEQGPEIIIDLRRLQTGDNYCYRVNMNSSRFVIQRRGITTIAAMIMAPALQPGDKVFVSVKGTVITVTVNGVVIGSVNDSGATEMQRAGTIAISKASTATGTQTYIRNLQIFSMS